MDETDEWGGFRIDLDDAADPDAIDAVIAACEAVEGVHVVRRDRSILVFGEAWEDAHDAAMTVLYLRGHLPALGEAGEA